jgi:D-alanine-D-alanine ligase-like ATP-grasp enzyme
MGGTGVNITPPPPRPVGSVEPEAVAAARARIARVANALGMEGYGRIDAFMHCKTGEIIVIEANSLPGLTPATVFFHQGLAEDPTMSPREILERILDLAVSRPM